MPTASGLRNRRDLGLRCVLFRSGTVLAITILLAGVFSAARAQDPDPRYWRPAQIAAAFESWSAAYPGIFHATTLGTSGEGAPILMARISDHPEVNEDEPAILFHAAQHSNECNGTGAIMRQMATLLEGYGNDTAVTAWVDSLELWFIPVLNPDGNGYVFSGEPHWSEWRKTLRDNNHNDLVDFPYDGVDLNRNWEWFWDECESDQPSDDNYKGTRAFSEAEAAALRSFVIAKRPVLVIDYHSPVTIEWTSEIFFPWSSTHGFGQSPDYEVAQSIASGWAASTRDENDHVYHSIYGYDTLPKEQNWVYGKCGILAFEMEISDHCWWNGAIVDSIAARVARGSTYLLDRVVDGPGIMGRITDAATGLPLSAEVEIAEMSAPEVGPRLSDATYGRFRRLTGSGEYTVLVSARNYVSESRTVTVSPNSWASVDVALGHDTSGLTVRDDEVAIPALRLANPARAGESVWLTVPAGSLPAAVEVYDLGGRLVASLGSGLEPGRDHELALPRDLARGGYLLRVRAGARDTSTRLTVIG